MNLPMYIEDYNNYMSISQLLLVYSKHILSLYSIKMFCTFYLPHNIGIPNTYMATYNATANKNN